MDDEISVKKTKSETAISAPSTPAPAPVPAPVPSSDGATRVYLGNLSFAIDDAKITEFFKDCGEVALVDWISDKTTGQFYGTGFITFTTSEAAQKALLKNGEDLLGRPIKVQMELSKSRTPSKIGGRSSEPRPKPEGCTTVFVGNVSFQITDEAITDLFKDCGEIIAIRWLSDRETGEFKGSGFVEFSDSASTDKAIAFNGQEVLGRAIRIDYSESKPKPQRDGQDDFKKRRF